MEKFTLKVAQSEIQKLTSIVIGSNKAIVALQTQVETLTQLLAQAQGQTVEVVPPCECNLVTCEECLSRAMGQTAPKTAPKAKAKADSTGSERPSSDADFKTVIVPFLASRVKHNIANNVECHTEKLVGYGNANVTDFRFFLTRDERRLYKAAFKGQKFSANDALIALAGACERMGVK